MAKIVVEDDEFYLCRDRTCTILYFEREDDRREAERCRAFETAVRNSALGA